MFYNRIFKIMSDHDQIRLVISFNIASTSIKTKSIKIYIL